MNNVKKLDILGKIDGEFIDSAAAMRQMGANKRKGLAVKLTAALAACFALVIMAAALPAMINGGEPTGPVALEGTSEVENSDTEEIIPIGNTILADIPAIEEGVRVASWSGHLRAPIAGSTDKELTEEDVVKLFDLSDFSQLTEMLGEVDLVRGEITYEPWGEVHHVLLQFGWESNKFISFIIDPKATYDSHVNGSIPLMTVGEYTVSKHIYYRGFDAITREPYRDNGCMVIKMQKTGAALWILADNMKRDGEALEAVYEFLLNAEYDLSRLETWNVEHLDYYEYGNSDSATYIEEEGMPESKYLRTPAEGCTVREMDVDEIKGLFKNTNEYIAAWFNIDSREIDGEITYTPEGEVHSIYLRLWYEWASKKEYIGVVIDPNVQFDLAEKKTDELNGGKVYTDIYCKITDYGNGRQGMEYYSILCFIQKADIGIQVRASRNMYLHNTPLINFVLYSDIDLASLTK